MSDNAFLRVVRAFETNPEFFNPTEIATSKGKINAGVINDVLISSGLRYRAGQVAAFWVQNALKLHRFWGGTPLSFVEEAVTYEDFVAILINRSKRHPDERNGFHGFQYKMTSMLVHFFITGDLMPRISFPPPIDIHHLRILTSHKLLVVEGMEDGIDLYKRQYLEAARRLTREYCDNTGVLHEDLGEALWNYSRTLCRHNPGNRSRVKGRRKGRNTEINPDPVTWKLSQQRAYARTCGSCIVADTCLFNIPGKVYTENGKLVIRGRRPTSPQVNLFSLDHQAD